MLFCAFVGIAWAQTPIKFADFDATKYYRIYSTTCDGGPHAIAPNADASKGAMAVYNTNDLNQIWQIIPATGENEGKYLLFNVRTQKYLCNVGGNTGANMNADVANANIGYYEIRLKAESEELVGFCHSGGDNQRHWLYNEAPALNGWNGNGHEYFYLEEATIPTAIPVAKLSDLSNDKVYVFKSGRSDATTSHYLLYHTDAPKNLSSTYSDAGHSMEFSESTTNFQFAIYNYEGKYYFYNIAAGKFVGNADDNNAAIPLVETITNAVEIRPSSNATYNFALSTNGTGALNVAATSGCHGVVNWTGGYSNLTDGGNIYQILEVGELSSADKNKLDTEVEKQMVIAEVNSIVNSTLGQNVVGAWTTDAKNALAVPLDLYINHATDADADTYFQALKAELDSWVSHPEEAKVQLLPGEKFTVKCVDTNRGYMVYSTVEGKGSETQAYLAGSNRAEFHAAVDAEGIYKEWAITSYQGKNYIYNVQKKQFINSDGVVKFTETPVALRLIDINNALWEIQFENNNKYLSFSPGWGADCVRTESGIDNGCKFYLEKTGESVADDVLSVVEKTFVDTWRNRVFQTINYIGGFPDSQTDAINAVNTLAKTVTYDETAERVAMAPGYYFIKKVNNSKYVTVDGINMMATATAEGINQIWKFEQIEGGYSLKHANLDAFVALEDADVNKGSATKVNSAEGATFTLEHKGNAQQLLKSNGNPMRTEGGGAVNYWWGDVNTTWYLIPATELEVDITAAGWATTHLPFDVVLPENLTAYAVSAVNMAEGATEGYASLIEKTSIPANQGAILEGEQGSYTLKIAQAEAWTDNKLKGTNVNAYIQGAAYVLGNKDGVALYKAELNKNAAGEAGDSHFLNNANKAYLPVEEGASLVLRFNFGGETTAIESVLNNGVDANAPIYDLSGRRVNNAVKGGIYIQNGKKFIVK